MNESTAAPARPLRQVMDVLRYMLTYKGWHMAFIAFVCIVFAFGSSVTTMPLIYGPAMDEFGWTRTEATLMFTYQNVASAVVAIFLIGPLLERYDIKPVMVVSSVVTGLGMASFLLIDSLWTYYLAGVLIGLGTATVLIVVKVFVARWFIRNVGLAIGLSVVGTSVGGVVFPMIAEALIAAHGWRVAFAALSLGIWFVVLPLYIFFANDRPTEEQIVPEAGQTRGQDGRYEAPTGELARRIKAAEFDVSYRELLCSPMFWMIVGAVFCTAFADAGMFQHTMLLLEREIGFDSRVAAASISATFALGIIAKVLAGRIFDKYSIRGIKYWYVFLGVSILLVFPLQGIFMLVLFTLARGLAHGGLVSSDTAVLAKHVYGPHLVGRVLAILTGTYAIGAGLGPAALSMVYDSTGSYFYGFVGFVILCTIAVVLMHGVRPHYRERLVAIIGDGAVPPGAPPAAPVAGGAAPVGSGPNAK